MIPAADFRLQKNKIETDNINSIRFRLFVFICFSICFFLPFQRHGLYFRVTINNQIGDICDQKTCRVGRSFFEQSIYEKYGIMACHHSDDGNAL